MRLQGTVAVLVGSNGACASSVRRRTAAWLKAGSCVDPMMRVHSADLLMVVAGVVGAGLLAPAHGQAVPEIEAAACESIDSKNECTGVPSCAWMGETCVVNRGVDDCECIDPWRARAESNPQCINATLSSDKQDLATCLPLSYGAGRCDAWDSQTVGLCVDQFGNVPDSGQGIWCQSSWCWVNGTTCQKPGGKSEIQWSGDIGIADDLFYRFVQKVPSSSSLLPLRPPLLPLLLLLLLMGLMPMVLIPMMPMT